MKRLKLLGYDGLVLSDTLVNVKGDNLRLDFKIPVSTPIFSITLEEEKKKEPRRGKKAQRLSA